MSYAQMSGLGMDIYRYIHRPLVGGSLIVRASIGIAQQSLLHGAYEPRKACQRFGHSGDNFIVGRWIKRKRNRRVAHNGGIYRVYASGIMGICKSKMWAHVGVSLCPVEPCRPHATVIESRLYATKGGGLFSGDGVAAKGCLLPATAAAVSIAAPLATTILSWTRLIHS